MADARPPRRRRWVLGLILAPALAALLALAVPGARLQLLRSLLESDQPRLAFEDPAVAEELVALLRAGVEASSVDLMRLVEANPPWLASWCPRPQDDAQRWLLSWRGGEGLEGLGWQLKVAGH